MESKKCNELVNTTKKEQTHRYIEQTSGYQSGEGQYRGGGVGGTNYRVQDRLKNVLYNTGNMTNIL